MIEKIEVGKKYENGYQAVEVLYVGENIVLYKYDNGTESYIHTKHALEHWNEIERETITLTEYICDVGFTRFLTEDKECITQGGIENDLDEVYLPDKCHKAPNARSYKVYADTLEPVR